MAIDPARPDEVLAALAGKAPKRAPTVRTLAQFAPVSTCNLAVLGFVSGTDFDKLLKGTDYEVPFGQSPFAFGRGLVFERSLAEGGHGKMLELLRDVMGFDVTDAKVVNLRDGYPQDRHGLVLRANETRRLLQQIVSGHPDAPNLIDGAVLRADIGGSPAYFEADAIAARFGGQIHVGEVKSFPIVDGRADPDKLGPALDQAALYVIHIRRALTGMGANPGLVSSEVMLIAPRNVGMQPTLARKDVSQRIIRMERLLEQVPSQAKMAAMVPAGVSFEAIADLDRPEADRVGRLHFLADQVGTKFCVNCLSSCGLARFCRARAHRAGDPQLAGPQIVQLLPRVRRFGRVVELASGAPPTVGETPVAQQLERAARLYDERFLGTPPQASAGSTP